MNKRLLIRSIIGVIICGGVLFLCQKPSLSPPRSIGLDIYGGVLRGERSLPSASLAQLSQTMTDMILWWEDRRFFRHPGVDLRALVRAIRFNIHDGGGIQGASTIDQQLIKIQQRAYQRSVSQKLKEVLLAFRLNLWYTKEDILLAYLNALPFPFQTQGIQAGCEMLFTRSCAQLRPSEQLFVLATTQLGKNPFTHEGFQQIKDRSGLLCRQIKAGTDLLSGVLCEDIDDQPPLSFQQLAGPQESEMLHITQRLQQIYGGKGTVQTAFDTELRQAIQDRIGASATQRRTVGARDCCVVVLDSQAQPISMNLCRERSDPEAGKVNGCLNKRQTGSAIKPFLYLYAMQLLGLDPTDTIVDEPVRFPLENGQTYAPQNFDLTYHGEVTLTQALGSSLNIPAVKLLHQAGAAGFLSFLINIRKIVGESATAIEHDMQDFTLENNGLSLALGTYELSPLEFTRLRTVWLRDDLGVYQKTATQIITMLGDRAAKLLSFDQDALINLPGRAVKTGTSRHFVDGWTCGLKVKDKKQTAESEIEQYVICVWMGNYDGSPMKEGGSLSAGYLWRLVAEMMEARKGK